MDQLTRKYRDLRHFGEVDWSLLAWQDRRMREDTVIQGKDSEKTAGGGSDTIIGVLYVGVLVVFMLVYLT